MSEVSERFASRLAPAADELVARLAPRPGERALDLEGGELQPQLRRLVHGREQQLVAMAHLGRRLLQREQLVRPEVALVVARAPAGQDRVDRHADGGWKRAIR